jgi:hypothetical protein
MEIINLYKTQRMIFRAIGSVLIKFLGIRYDGIKCDFTFEIIPSCWIKKKEG